MGRSKKLRPVDAEPTRDPAEEASVAAEGGAPSDFRMIDAKTVAEILGVEISTVWRKSRSGQLPRPIKVAGLTRWRLSDIRAAIDAAARKDGEAA